MKRIATEGNIVSRMGANIVLGEYECAESILQSLLSDSLDDWPSQEEVWRWPILRLLEPHLKDRDLRDRLNRETRKPFGMGRVSE